MKGIVIEDYESLRKGIARGLEDDGYEIIGQFVTVDKGMEFLGYDLAKKQFTKPLPEIDFIHTDNDTVSTLTGMDLVKLMRGKGVGVVIRTGDARIDANIVKEVGGSGAVYASKSERADTILSSIKKAITNAMVEKTAGGQKPGGREDI